MIISYYDTGGEAGFESGDPFCNQANMTVLPHKQSEYPLLDRVRS